MTILEIIAAIFGFLCVCFYIIRNVWSWPTGLVQVLLLIAVFYHAKLYADMALHVVYVGLQIFGWVAWQKSLRIAPSVAAGSEAIVVRSLNLRGNITCILATILLTVAFSSMLVHWTDAELPIVDSFVAAASLVAQYLLATRHLENWIYWIVVDTVGVGLFAYKELYPTAILYALFWVMAIVGLVVWNRDAQQQNSRVTRSI
jgi:nicotinamide mononucleotide transporter